VVNNKADIIRVFLPPDANALLCVTDQCLRSRDRVNVIVAGKQPALQYLGSTSADTGRICPKSRRGNGRPDGSGVVEKKPGRVCACAGILPGESAAYPK